MFKNHITGVFSHKTASLPSIQDYRAAFVIGQVPDPFIIHFILPVTSSAFNFLSRSSSSAMSSAFRCVYLANI